ncbi:hypothetical protein [Flavobacterium sp. WV_118_3]|uniref:hypothetical protein n=1 Tax=Flavobacterium sp. WV_118_3 TaxID=3151764 RepID=UPI00321A99E7
MKKLLIFLLIMIPTIFIAQEVQTEELRDANGKLISKTVINPNKREKSLTAEEIADLFYKNQNNVKHLNSLMSFRFYQKTPYFKFKEIMEQKNQTFGKFLNKTLISVTNPEKGITIHKYKVNYKKRTTVEEIGFIKENEGDSYEVISYNIN